MSDEVEVLDAEHEVEVAEGGSKEQQRAARGVDSVTDFVQEANAADEGKVMDAVGALGAIKETLPAPVTFKEEDIKLLVDECEVSSETAQYLLRKAGGNVKAAMVEFIRQ